MRRASAGTCSSIPSTSAGAAASSPATSSRTTRASTATQSSRSPRRPRRPATTEHAREEADHVRLWDEFAAAFGADTTRGPSPETGECVIAWTAPGNRLEAMAVMYAIEAGQPDVSQAKLDGLAEHYGVANDEPGAAYFALHAERDHEHAAESRRALEEDADGRRRRSPRRGCRIGPEGQLDPAERSRRQEVAMKWLLRGFPGHPLHPPLTDVTIGAYTLATAMAVLSRLGVSEENTATAWWLALIVGLVVTAPTAITGSWNGSTSRAARRCGGLRRCT